MRFRNDKPTVYIIAGPNGAGKLAYRLYTLCERLGQAEDARAYNELITSWTGIETAATTAPKPAQGELFT